MKHFRGSRERGLARTSFEYSTLGLITLIFSLVSVIHLSLALAGLWADARAAHAVASRHKLDYKCKCCLDRVL